MLFYSILAFSLFLVSDASSPTNNSDPKYEETKSSVLGPVGKLHVMNRNAAPDGFNRSVSVINGQLPGPLIRANKGDIISMKVFNELTDPSMPVDTALHYHGMFQHQSNWADGAASVTQCPLRQKETFVQTFDTAPQTGTYWYHGHVPAQYCQGVAGPMVIYDPEDPQRYMYDVDDEHTVITVQDWNHSPKVPVDVFGFPNSTLINGSGRFPGGPAVPLSVVNVKQGLRYRFRIVGMSCLASFNFSIDGHKMTVIEADGNAVQPVEVDSLTLFAGQRYSVVVPAKQTPGNYRIRALPNLPNTTFEGGQHSAILRYDGAPDEDPTSSPSYEHALAETELHPLTNPSAPGTPGIGNADVSLVLAPGFNPTTKQFTFGNTTFIPPTVPILLQMINGARTPWQLMPAESIIALPPNKTIEITFPDPNAGPGAPHPVHMHGNSFSVVRSAGSNVTNFVNPVRRDVVSIGKNSTDEVTIRFKTDNPGPWIVHCHLEPHFKHGFAKVLAVAPDEAAKQEALVVPEDWRDLCK